MRTLSKIDFVQLSGRAGRKGYFEEGFVGFLSQDFIYYEPSDFAKKNYEQLLTASMEEPRIRLEIDIWAVVQGKTTLEKEVEYVVNFSEPPRDRKEVEEEANEIRKLLDGASELEKEFLKSFTCPSFLFKETYTLPNTFSSLHSRISQRRRQNRTLQTDFSQRSIQGKGHIRIIAPSSHRQKAKQEEV